MRESEAFNWVVWRRFSGGRGPRQGRMDSSRLLPDFQVEIAKWRALRLETARLMLVGKAPAPKSLQCRCGHPPAVGPGVNQKARSRRQHPPVARPSRTLTLAFNRTLELTSDVGVGIRVNRRLAVESGIPVLPVERRKSAPNRRESCRHNRFPGEKTTRPVQLDRLPVQANAIKMRIASAPWLGGHWARLTTERFVF